MRDFCGRKPRGRHGLYVDVNAVFSIYMKSCKSYNETEEEKMTYKNEMVLPKNAVIMDSEEMLLAGSGVFNFLTGFVASAALSGAIKSVTGYTLDDYFAQIIKKNNKAGWRTYRNSHGTVIKMYWNGKKYTNSKVVSYGV